LNIKNKGNEAIDSQNKQGTEISNSLAIAVITRRPSRGLPWLWATLELFAFWL